MKFRPQIQLRFRDEAQYVLVKDAAQAQALSVNEWILQKLENGTGGGKVDAGALSAPAGEVSARKELAHSGGSSPSPVPSKSKVRHDTKACRVRLCGMCKVLGVVDAQRGLK